MPGEKKDELCELGLALALAVCRRVDHALDLVKGLEEALLRARGVGQIREALKAEAVDEHGTDACCIGDGTEEVGQRGHG